MPTSPGPIAHVPLLHTKLPVWNDGGAVVAPAATTELNPTHAIIATATKTPGSHSHDLLLSRGRSRRGPAQAIP
jgi:hypothetical protein